MISLPLQDLQRTLQPDLQACDIQATSVNIKIQETNLAEASRGAVGLALLSFTIPPTSQGSAVRLCQLQVFLYDVFCGCILDPHHKEFMSPGQEQILNKLCTQRKRGKLEIT